MVTTIIMIFLWFYGIIGVLYTLAVIIELIQEGYKWWTYSIDVPRTVASSVWLNTILVMLMWGIYILLHTYVTYKLAG